MVRANKTKAWSMANRRRRVNALGGDLKGEGGGRPPLARA